MEKIDKKNEAMIVEAQYYTFGKDGDTLTLRSGKVLPEVTVCYEAYGTLSEKKDNAILICHALTGDAHAAGKHSEDDKKPGWWDVLIGPGKAVDTNKYFVVCSSIIGSCYGSTGPESINPETGKIYGLDFPMITIADMVDAQKHLMDHLTIDKWLAVLGGSLGGMQALQWSVSYPDKLQACMPIATTAHLSPQGIAFDWVGREAILHDPNFKDGEYSKDALPEKGLSIARMLAHITYLSEESMNRKFGRGLQEMDTYNFEFSHNFQVESYLKYQGTQFVNRFDANSYLYITRAMDYFDLAAEGEGSLAKAMAKTKADFLIVSFTSDWLFPTSHSREIVEALQECRKPVTFCEIESDAGHDAFLLEFETLGGMVGNFLKSSEEAYDV